MKSKIILLWSLVALSILAACGSAPPTPSAPPPAPTITPTLAPTATPLPTPTPTAHPLSVARMRAQDYPGSEITVEQTLAPGSNYKRYVVSYLSEGLKIYALLTIPNGAKPKTGFPVIVFNHGYIPPAQYKTTERYVAYVDAFAKNGYLVFRPDYRGHGESEGIASGGYGSPDYTIDVLNALASVKKHKDADPNRIGMWGHSMGGSITLRAMVTTQEIKAGVIWAGVVAAYPDLMYNWNRSGTPAPTPAIPSAGRRWRQDWVNIYGTPEQNPEFWDSISPNAHLTELSGPLQLHHGTADTTVPFAFSETLHKQMQAVGKPVEFFSYKGDNHNISINLNLALQRSVAFFNKYVKG